MLMEEVGRATRRINLLLWHPIRFYILMLSLLFVPFGNSYAQVDPSQKPEGNKGKFYCYWGWNRSWYTKSTISFIGGNYDFTLKRVVANDRQTPFDFKTYFNPVTLTIPQYNVRLGYFIKDKYSVSIGTDHMKYVVKANQVVKISGHIKGSGTKYDGSYADNDIAITEDFLKLEHTDGLNYANIDYRRHDQISTYKKIKFNLNEGVGLGIMLPRTDATLLSKVRHDAFHLAGWGVSGVVAANIEFWRVFFIQSELKAGYINMPDIRTTSSDADKASQQFFFTQFNVLFGVHLD